MKGIMLLLIMGVGLYFLMNRDVASEIFIDAEAVRPAEGFENNYYHVSQAWDANKPSGVHKVIDATRITNDTFRVDEFDTPVFRMNRGESVSFSVTVPEDGVYTIALDQMDVAESILVNAIAVKVNGSIPYEEARMIELPTRWVFSSSTFPHDRYGNEIMPNAIKTQAFFKTFLHDSTGLNAAPLQFKLEAGENTITIEQMRGTSLVGKVHVESVDVLPTYEAYRAKHEGTLQTDEAITVGAETLEYRTNPSIRLRSLRDPSATSYHTRFLRLNAIDGYSFRKGNDTIAYTIEVPTSGYYHIGFKYQQNFLMQMPVFREIRINNQVPFQEVSMEAFHHSSRYRNHLLGGETPYQFYLEAGTNTIAMRVVVEPYRNAYENVIRVMDEMTDLSLEIKKLTGNTTDRYRTWRIEDFIPDIGDRLDRWIEILEHVDTNLSKYSPVEEPSELTNLRLAIRQLKQLNEDVNDIPNRMRMLADGDSSTAQLLGTSIQNYLQNGLSIEKMVVTGADAMPAPRANVFVNTFEGVRRFFISFTHDDYAIGDVDDDVLNIWVNYPRQYLEIMQQIIDSEFTAETGIRVQLSLMPDENKLVLANAANNSPDIALGVNHWLPYEFAIRNASLDLRHFEGYEETVAQFAPGMMVPYAFEDGVYGLPLTQNFWVTHYRTDILDALDLPVPETWDEVIEILPELQRFGMNYYQPLAFFGGFKPFVATMPFIYQFGGQLYSEDGMETMINSEATIEGIRLMSELFTIYNMPKEVPNFYNHFRYGTLPIGISDLSTYLQLSIAAPEIAGKWNIAPHPGVRNEQGIIERWAPSGAQASVIMSATDQPDESWEFLQWWMTTQTQAHFATRLQTTYGTEYLWNTANLEAFSQLPIPEEHIDVILAQWEWALEASRIPGAYMVEREISNAWNRIVFNDANPRIALDEAVRVANREITYRMEEFGYVENGLVLKPYRVPTIHNIEYWLKGHDND